MDCAEEEGVLEEAVLGGIVEDATVPYELTSVPSEEVDRGAVDNNVVGDVDADAEVIGEEVETRLLLVPCPEEEGVSELKSGGV